MSGDYKITTSQSATTYRIIIAPTTQRGYSTTGGAIQTLLLDGSLWSTLVSANFYFIPNYHITLLPKINKLELIKKLGLSSNTQCNAAA
ncbi:MAG: hypothetical protein J0M08_05355 [Bacteroidetes bacterium]|nr:hypothetical protein [Bacteroidota bacterium]